MYLIKCFDVSNWQEIIPDPGLFRTEMEAIAYCDEHNGETKGMLYSWKKVNVGEMDNA